MKVRIECDTLALEVTRRCNMCCDHCLRGNAQNLDMDTTIVEKIARLVHPGDVTFTGGEPSLNISAIQKYFELAERYDTLPYDFFVATNGLTNQEELAITLLKAYPKMEEKDMCCLTISVDDFHERFWDDVDPTYNSIFEGLSFFDPESKHHQTDGSDDYRWIIPLGRAKGNFDDNERTTFMFEPSNNMTDMCNNAEISYSKKNDTFTIRFETLYISANGVISDVCDIAYETLDELHISTIDTIESDILSYAMTTPIIG